MKTINTESIPRSYRGFGRDFIDYLINLTPVSETFKVIEGNEEVIISVIIDIKDDYDCDIKIRRIM